MSTPIAPSDGKGLYVDRMERLYKASHTAYGPDWKTEVLVDDLRALLEEHAKLEKEARRIK